MDCWVSSIRSNELERKEMIDRQEGGVYQGFADDGL